MKSGEKVVCFEYFFTENKENIEYGFGPSSFDLIHYEIIDPIKLDEDRIWNLACPASPIHY